MKTYKYDAVVIGSGNGGLMGACKMASLGMKVLLLEQHNVPGGFASSFVRGRFEFEPALHELGAVGDEQNPGYVRDMFNELKVNINWNRIREAFTLVIGKDKSDMKTYTFPFGKEEFAKQMEKYEKGSYEKVIKFLDICDDIYDAIAFIEQKKGQVTPKELKKLYPNYVSTGSYTLEQVLDSLKMSEFTKNVISAYWIYLGPPPKDLDFTLYAVMMAEYINYGAYVPLNRSNEISSALVSKLLELKGDVWFNCKAEKILVENGAVKGVVTKDAIIKTDFVLANCSPNIVYGEMIDKQHVPSYDKKLVNFRKFNKQGYSFYLGLNVDASKLNLTDYSYFVFPDINQNKLALDLNSIDKNLTYVVVVLNNANKKVSPEGTCILSFTTLYEDAWNNVKDVDYYKIKEKIAEKMIIDFEQKMNIKIRPYIEEIEVATPVTFARYTGVKNGVIYGYAPDKFDASLSKSRNMEKEINIKGLKFVGGFSYRSHGYSTTYRSGYTMGFKTFGEFKKKGAQ